MEIARLSGPQETTISDLIKGGSIPMKLLCKKGYYILPLPFSLRVEDLASVKIFVFWIHCWYSF